MKISSRFLERDEIVMDSRKMDSKEITSHALLKKKITKNKTSQATNYCYFCSR